MDRKRFYVGDYTPKCDHDKCEKPASYVVEDPEGQPFRLCEEHVKQIPKGWKKWKLVKLGKG